MDKPDTAAPGLKWRRRKDRQVPYWIPRSDAVAAGYPCGTINLESIFDGSDLGAALLRDRCAALQTDMLLWLAGQRRDRASYDGSIRSILNIYEVHEDSPYKKLKPASRHPYEVYLAKLKAHVGGRLVRNVSGLDVKQWWKVWADADANGRSPKKVAAGSMAFRVLKEAVKFGGVCGIDDCNKLFSMIALLQFPRPKARQAVATAEHVIAARAEAHRLGQKALALAYALQYETVLRLWDVIGQWYPMDYPVVSVVLRHDMKWVGLEWRHIGPDMILRYMPSKTEMTTEAEHTVDLRLCPMVLEELQHWPVEARSGPVITDNRTGLPYLERRARDWWNRVRKNSGLPPGLWGRDLRASAVTEGRRGNASTDDASKVAAHSSPRTTAEVYDRDRLEAHRRFANARLSVRNGSGTTSGTDGE
jgi:integrase